MRAPQWVSEFFEWRWAPCVGLTAGSLAFVAFALVLIPTHFGEARVVSTLSAYDAPRPQRAIFSSALARPEAGGDEDHRAELARNARITRAVSPPPRNPEAPAPVQRGFSPVLERPEPLTPPPAPPPVPPPAPTPAPVATLTAAIAVPPPVPANASAEPPAPMPGTVVVIQPEAGGPAREVTNQ